MAEAEAAPANTAEIALNVERYVLPKFKVAVDFGSKDAKIKRGYRSGDHVTERCAQNYFFGKPVDGGEITVKASGMDVAVVEWLQPRARQTTMAHIILTSSAQLFCWASAQPRRGPRADRGHGEDSAATLRPAANQSP